MNKLQFWDLIIGMILGDGYLTTLRPQRKNSALRINHSIKQQEYLRYKANILEYLTKVRIREYMGKIGNREYPMIYAETMQHPFYTKARQRIYQFGRKEINSFMLKRLGLNGIAIWFGDDGYIEKNQIQLATNCFTESENYFVKKWLAKKGLYCSVGRRKHYYLRFSADSTEKILNHAKKMKIPLEKVCSYDRLPRPDCLNEKGQFKKGHHNELKWG